MGKIYTLKELEALLKVTNRTLLRYIESGRLEAFKVGGRWRVTEEALEKFLTASTKGE